MSDFVCSFSFQKFLSTQYELHLFWSLLNCLKSLKQDLKEVCENHLGQFLSRNFRSSTVPELCFTRKMATTPQSKWHIYHCASVLETDITFHWITKKEITFSPTNITSFNEILIVQHPLLISYEKLKKTSSS